MAYHEDDPTRWETGLTTPRDPQYPEGSLVRAALAVAALIFVTAVLLGLAARLILYLAIGR